MKLTSPDQPNKIITNIVTLTIMFYVTNRVPRKCVCMLLEPCSVFLKGSNSICTTSSVLLISFFIPVVSIMTNKNHVSYVDNNDYHYVTFSNLLYSLRWFYDFYQHVVYPLWLFPRNVVFKQALRVHNIIIL